jgi:hypothetical protein
MSQMIDMGSRHGARFTCQHLVLAGILPFLAATVPSLAQSDSPSVVPTGPIAAPLALAANPEPMASDPEPAPAPHKRKAGFLAAGGLVVLSLLVLATGVALVRAFRRR